MIGNHDGLVAHAGLKTAFVIEKMRHTQGLATEHYQLQLN